MTKDKILSLVFNKKLWVSLQLFFMLVRDYRSGNFRKITFAKIMIICATIIYIVSPVDVIPDIFIGIGWLDDISLAIYISKILHNELKLYCKINNIII